MALPLKRGPGPSPVPVSAGQKRHTVLDFEMPPLRELHHSSQDASAGNVTSRISLPLRSRRQRLMAASSRDGCHRAPLICRSAPKDHGGKRKEQKDASIRTRYQISILTDTCQCVSRALGSNCAALIWRAKRCPDDTPELTPCHFLLRLHTRPC